MRIAVKPPSSISREQETVDTSGKPAKISVGGRHDPCICPRIVPVAEAMVALVLIDHLLLQERISRAGDLETLRNKIDTLDAQLLLMLAQRRKVIEDIATVKKQSGKKVFDKEREAAINARWKSISESLNISNEISQSLLQSLLKDSHSIQKEILL